MTSTSPRTLSPERREALLAELERLLLSEGFRGTSVDELAAHLSCSKATLYGLAPSREQLVVSVVKHFFRDAAAGIEESVAAVGDPRERIAAYLAGVGREMRRASPAFYADMTQFAPTAEIYRRNSLVAARRVRELIHEGVEQGAFRTVHAEFAGHVVAVAIDAIQRGDLLAATGLSSGDAYTELGELIVRGLAA